MDYDPISVALKFGFLAVLYLFLLVDRAQRAEGPAPDRRAGARRDRLPRRRRPTPRRRGGGDAWLVAERGGGLEPGERFDLIGGLSIGRSSEADVRIDDRYASGIHARVFNRDGRTYVEDMNSTNGTLLNDADAERRGGADRRRHRSGSATPSSGSRPATRCCAIDDQAFRTDTGRQRNANEDSLFVRAPIFVVADGMGGAQAGEVASKAAAEAFDRELPDGPAGAGPARDDRGGQPARSTSSPATTLALAGMGTTITAAIVDPETEEVAIGHVGDSRAYRLRGGKLERRARDHEQEEVEDGDEAEFEGHGDRVIIHPPVDPHHPRPLTARCRTEMSSCRSSPGRRG